MKERPVYRQPITPWYDSTPVCRFFFWLLVPVFIFAFAGFLEALNTPDWQIHIWMPMALGMMSFLVMLRLAVRLRRRRRADQDS
ncbi:hypothetical protein LJC24_01960 [Desulfococcaceae bacterium OttesenSCG-928-F15]|nr:hypothetical protein [Desulfococcaceae bacterium OttesenSCG-928-F15]